jgi:hypothetical protein
MQNKLQDLADITLRTNELAVTLTQVILPLVESAVADGKIADSKELRDGIESLRSLYKKSLDDMPATRRSFGLRD